MSSPRLWLVTCILLQIAVHHALGQEPHPIMELSVPDPNNIINYSGCNTGLLNDVDFFTVRGKVNKNGADPNAYKDTNLYLQAVRDPSTNAWASQCRPILTVCSSSLTTNCYCERKDPNGDYHLVMTIMAKSIYSGGKLMLSWNDARSPYNPPVTSNMADYPGPIWDQDQKNVTLKTGSTEIILDGNPSSDNYKNLSLPYTQDMTNLTFCVYNLKATEFIKIENDGKILAYTTTEPCVTLDLGKESQDGILNMSFAESGGCERTDSYALHLESSFQPTTTARTTTTSTTNDLRNFCKQGNLTDGNYPYPNQACSKKYIQCNRWLTIIIDCPSNMVYNEVRQLCDNPDNVHNCGQTDDVSNFCSLNHHAHGNYSHPTECHMFIQCITYFTAIMSCPEGFVFNSATAQCDFPTNVPGCDNQGHGGTSSTTRLPSGYDTYCLDNNLSTGIHPDPYSCYYFVECTFGRTDHMACPVGLAFSVDLSVCIEVDKVDCSQNIVG